MRRFCFLIDRESFSRFDPASLLRMQRGIDFLTLCMAGERYESGCGAQFRWKGNVLTFTCANTGNALLRKISFACAILSGNLTRLFTLTGMVHSKLRFRFEISPLPFAPDVDRGCCDVFMTSIYNLFFFLLSWRVGIPPNG